ncbi:MAG: hypothetical protein HN542_10815 [Flavobacteriales bacterium]|nr:hypothetical protein [Flavobacteriales bacterium]MBT3964066.1 hypothetical protein [Flavobacteriales bacterium]MBT4704420.1 hypothetical protein [Flavobacteriales bacterium]MBT4929469.1 hypothetical protein [Flavobacteriales bacterium]MBT5131925.1 hypothetical protein [Flavobacteriales bacterium]
MELKKILKDSIPHALEKARRYRLLNEPWQAESICRDILSVDPGNQLAIHTSLLAISDQFITSTNTRYPRAKDLCEQLEDPYEKLYYRGIIEERTGNAALKRTGPQTRYIAYNHYKKAMEFYEEAEAQRPDENEDSVLRWNACLRAIEEFKLVSSRDVEHPPQPFME